MNELIEAMPKAWSSVTLDKWQAICRVKDEDETERTIQWLTILLECSEDQIRELDLNSWRVLLESASFVNRRIVEEVKTTFELNGKMYGIIPKMDAQFLTTGEFLDLEQWKKEPTENIHLIAALIYRPVRWIDGDDYAIEKYDREGFMKRADLFLKELPITHCYAAVLFFSAYVMQFTEIITDYLVAVNPKAKSQMKKRQKASKKHKQENSIKSGDGII